LRGKKNSVESALCVFHHWYAKAGEAINVEMFFALLIKFFSQAPDSKKFR